MKKLTPVQKEAAINKAVKKAQSQTGLAIDIITSSPALTQAFQDGLGDIYARVFAEPPFEERHSPSEVHKIFTDYMQQGARIFVARDQNAPDRPVRAFIVSTPLSAAFLKASGLDHISSLSQACYLAEDGVAPAARNRGVSAAMKELLFTVNRLAGYKGVISRTNIQNYAQINAFAKKGGRVLSDIFHEVSAPRCDGQVRKDTRSYYLFPLNNHARNDNRYQTATFDAALLQLKAQKKDALVIKTKMLEEATRRVLERYIRKTYPAIKTIAFAQCGDLTEERRAADLIGRSDKTLIFEGRFAVTPPYTPPPALPKARPA